MQDTVEKLTKFLKNLGADIILDLKLAEDWSILELQKEFLERYREGGHDDSVKVKPNPMLSSLCPGIIKNIFLIYIDMFFVKVGSAMQRKLMESGYFLTFQS